MKVEIEVDDFPSYLRACLGAAGMSQSGLARRLGMTTSVVSRWATGKGIPTVSVLVEMCDVIAPRKGPYLSRAKRMSLEVAAVLLAHDVRAKMRRAAKRETRASSSDIHPGGT